MAHSHALRLADPREIPAGYWDACPYCEHPVFMPIAGSKESKSYVKCPGCAAAIKPDC